MYPLSLLISSKLTQFHRSIDSRRGSIQLINWAKNSYKTQKPPPSILAESGISLELRQLHHHCLDLGHQRKISLSSLPHWKWPHMDSSHLRRVTYSFSSFKMFFQRLLIQKISRYGSKHNQKTNFEIYFKILLNNLWCHCLFISLRAIWCIGNLKWEKLICELFPSH